jgi:hypothetical protein
LVNITLRRRRRGGGGAAGDDRRLFGDHHFDSGGDCKISSSTGCGTDFVSGIKSTLSGLGVIRSSDCEFFFFVVVVLL